MGLKKNVKQKNLLSMIRFLALFAAVGIGQDAISQTQKHFTTFTGDDVLADFSCIDARRVSFNADKFNYNYNNSGITRLSSAADKYKANVIAPDRVLGNARVQYKIGPGQWLPIYDGATRAELVSPGKVVYTDYEEGMPIKMERTFFMVDGGIELTIKLQTMMKYPITIGNFELPFPAAGPPGEGYDPMGRRYDHDLIYEQTFSTHQYIAGDASYLYFTRRSGEPPFLLVMTKPGTRLEYFRGSSVFIHSGLEAGEPDERKGRWENTMLELSPAGEKGSTVEYGFRLEWVDSYDEMREVLYNNGLFDTRVVPGMTLPQGLKAKVSLHTKNEIDSITAEYPQQTTIRFLESKAPGYKIFEVDFKRLGENLLTIDYNGGEKAILEFFSTEPLETLIQKRSAFITRQQQHRDASKWYNGLYSVWDMEHSVLRGPDNTDGFDFFYGFVLAGDDPALCKAPLVAAKNVYMPDDKEISSVEYYIKNFLWGGLQRTDKELPYPYGIYSVPNWQVSRDDFLFAGIRNSGLNMMNIWRNYDYPHIVMLYYHMFQIAEYYPEKVKYLDAVGYLERAFQTAKAYFIYPYEIYPWEDTYKWGIMNELVILPLIVDLERYGRKEDAAWLRNEWEKKVKYFVYDDKYPYHSEYCTGGTAFSSTYALAKYGTLTPMKPDKNLWYDTNLKKWWSHPDVKQEDSRKFMDRQFLGSFATRGCLIPAYYNLGTTPRLCYRTRLGGEGLLDFALHFADEPWDWLQWGYSSYLGPFALINTGTAESDYGYWYPGKENDGATGWDFNRGKGSMRFTEGRNRYIPYGAQPYDGEADIGHVVIMRMASTLIANDPLFGWIAYGGELEINDGKFLVIPEDGLGIRFGFVTRTTRILTELSRDRFSKEIPIATDKEGTSTTLPISNVTGDAHKIQLKLTGTAGSIYTVKIDGNNIGQKELRGAVPVFVEFEMPEEGCRVELLRRN